LGKFRELLLKILLRKEVQTMAVVYATLIVKGKKTLEQVPAKLREEVEGILEALEVKEALFYLDQQVSNSGRLRALLLDKAAERGVQVRVELHPSVDGVLSRLENVVTTDAIILDKCGSWYNLNRGIIEEAVPEAWVLRLEPSYI